MNCIMLVVFRHKMLLFKQHTHSQLIMLCYKFYIIIISIIGE